MRVIVGILITVGLIVLILFLLLSGGNSGPTIKPLRLIDYAHSNSAAQLIIDGPIVANQNHNEIKITVSPQSVDFTLYNTYEQQTINSQSYPNNERSYSVFLQALQHAGFTKGNTDKTLVDERGFCPSGIRDIYSFANASRPLMRFWSTSCGDGTYKGRIETTVNLFKKQVPDYGNLTHNVNFLD